MTTTIRPIYLYGATEAHRAALRKAKAELGYDFQCQFVQARPEQDGRVLAFEELPFICERLSPARRSPQEAVQWALGMLDLPEALDYAGVLSEWLGCEVKEVAE